jgi:glycosyltransferase involved in cell wall biosynthesis
VQEVRVTDQIQRLGAGRGFDEKQSFETTDGRAFGCDPGCGRGTVMTPRIPLPAGPGGEGQALDHLVAPSSALLEEGRRLSAGDVTVAAPGIPRHVLLVGHVEQHSGPVRSLAPRLAALAERGTKITTLLPREGSAATVAGGLGDVLYGTPGALTLPHGPLGAARAAASVRAQRRVVGRIARELACDLVILTSIRLPGAMLAARKAGVGLVVYAGEPPAIRGSSRVAGAMLARLTGRMADAIVVPSRRSAARLGALGLETEIVTPPIALGAREREVRARADELRASLGFAPDDRVVASLGAITSGRGQDVLIEALAGIAPGERGWKLMIGGEPYSREEDLAFFASLRSMVAAAGLEGRVVFTGAVSDVAAFQAAADVFANSARVEESFGRAACEALLAGSAIVATRPAAAEGILDDERTALIVPVNNPPATAKAIQRLFDDPELAESTNAAGAAEVLRRCAFDVGQPGFEAALARALGVADPHGLFEPAAVVASGTGSS